MHQAGMICKADGFEHSQGHGGPKLEKDSYRLVEEPSGTRRPLKVIVVGAGASAINFAHEVSTSSLEIDIVCYDKNPEVGGTWFENRYPGCACDIPSVNYQFTWAPRVWSSYYATAPEILAYFKGIADDYDLRKYMRLNHLVTDACWDETKQRWEVIVQDMATGEVTHHDCNVLINASGVLNKWKWPDIKGRETFRGSMSHTANWDPSISYEGKRVAVIGGGASAVQLVSKIQPAVSSMTCFLRSSSWITAGFAQRFAGPQGSNFAYTDQQKEIFQNDPVKYLQYRKCIESELSVRFKFILNGSREQIQARAFAEAEMRRKLERKPQVADVLIPKNYAVGCRRPIPGNGYLEALCEENVNVVTTQIAEINESGIKTTDGVQHDVDLIVCGTGFDTSWRPRYPTIGRGGIDLRDAWASQPETYLSVMAPSFPNYLIFNGPFGPYGHGSFLPITERSAKYFMQLLDKMSSERLSSFAPTQAAVDDFAEHRRKFLPRTAWTSPCRSWFKGGTVDGEVMMWPGSRLHFFEALRTPRWEDFELRGLERNRFAYLGNGFTAREFDGRDLSWYMGLLDGKDEQPAFAEEDVAEFAAAVEI